MRGSILGQVTIQFTTDSLRVLLYCVGPLVFDEVTLTNRVQFSVIFRTLAALKVWQKHCKEQLDTSPFLFVVASRWAIVESSQSTTWLRARNHRLMLSRCVQETAKQIVSNFGEVLAQLAHKLAPRRS